MFSQLKKAFFKLPKAWLTGTRSPLWNIFLLGSLFLVGCGEIDTGVRIDTESVNTEPSPLPLTATPEPTVTPSAPVSSSKPEPTTQPRGTSRPFLGTPFMLPSIIEAEFYNWNGFFDSTEGNLGGVYRSDDVDLEMTENGEYVVAGIQDKEWLEYTIYSTSDKDYQFAINALSILEHGSVSLYVNGDLVLADRSITNRSGNSKQYEWYQLGVISLRSGEHLVRLYIDRAGININSLRFEALSTPIPTSTVVAQPSATPKPTPTITTHPTATPEPAATLEPTPAITAKPRTTPEPKPTITARPTNTPEPKPTNTPKSPSDPSRPFLENPFILPTLIEAEYYNLDGFFDTTPGNRGDVYRSDDVDLELSYDGTYNIGWIESQEWFEYSVYSISKQNYRLAINLSSQMQSGEVSIYVNGNLVLANRVLPITGSWKAYEWYELGIVPLDDGEHIVRVYAEKAGMNINSLRFEEYTNAVKTPEPKPTATLTPRPIDTPKPTMTPVSKPTITSTPQPRMTPISRPTATLTPKPTITHTPAPAVTLTPKPTMTPIPTPTATLTPKPTMTPIPTPTVTLTPKPTMTPKPTPTNTPPEQGIGDGNLLKGQQQYDQLCVSCHGNDGKSFPGVSLAEGECKNCKSFNSLVDVIESRMPPGRTFACDSDCAKNTASYILNGFNVAENPTSPVAMKSQHIKSLPQTLKKFSLAALGRVPTQEELNLAETEQGFDHVVKQMMNNDNFGNWVKDIFNDLLLTNKYGLHGKYVKSVVNPDVYPNLSETESGPNPIGDVLFKPKTGCGNQLYQVSLGHEPLELIKYIAMNNRHIDEIITADYRMVNFYSQRDVYKGQLIHDNNGNIPTFNKIYIDKINTNQFICWEKHFADEINEISKEDRFYYDYNHFLPAKMGDIPLSGVLTSEIFLERYPTNASNKNRTRANKVFKYFLDENIGASLVNGFKSEGYKYPTLEDPNCTGCHNRMDPVASAFRNWDHWGEYKFRDLNKYWETEGILPPGFGGVEAPNMNNPLQWMAKQLVKDKRRYRGAIIRTIYNGLMGKYDNPEYFREIYDTFVEESIDTTDIKSIVLALIKYEDYRVDGALNSENEVKANFSRSLPPEVLQRKSFSMTGVNWKLFHIPGFKVLLGGSDYDQLPDRRTVINSVSSSMTERMASELACYALKEDFSKPSYSRLLFPLVEVNTKPDSEENIEKIKNNIMHLLWNILGEKPNESSEELNSVYELYNSIHEDSKSKNRRRSLHHLCLPEGILYDDHSTLKPWLAVLNYLFLDYRFMHE